MFVKMFVVQVFTRKKYILKYINGSRYGYAFHTALHHTKEARTDITAMLRNNARKEMRTLVNAKSLACFQKVNRTTAEAFSWIIILDECRRHLPLLWAVIEGSLTVRNKLHTIERYIL